MKKTLFFILMYFSMLIEIQSGPLFEIHQEGQIFNVVIYYNEYKTDSAIYIVNSRDSSIMFPDGIQATYPLSRIGITTVAHFSCLKKMNCLDRVTAMSGTRFLSSEEDRELIKRYEIVEIGTESGLNRELVLAKDIKAFFINITGSPYDVNETLSRLKRPFIPTFEWKEENLLDKSAWIKLMALFLGEYDKGEDIYGLIKEEYNRILFKKKTVDKKILWASIFNGQVWMAGKGSYVLNLLRDCGALNVNGSLVKKVNQVTLEHFFELFTDADIFVYSGALKSLEELIAIEPRIKKHQAYKNMKIYCVKTKYYEDGLLNPHKILLEMMKILNNDLKKGDFFLKLK